MIVLIIQEKAFEEMAAKLSRFSEFCFLARGVYAYWIHALFTSSYVLSGDSPIQFSGFYR